MIGLLLVLAGLWILLGAVWLALWPVVAGSREGLSPAALDRRELEAEKGRLIGEIHELELDRATGKLSEPDYSTAEADLKARAFEVMRQIDQTT